MGEIEELRVNADLMREIVNAQTAAFDEWRHAFEDREDRELTWVEALMAFHNVHRRIIVDILARIPDGSAFEATPADAIPAVSEMVIVIAEETWTRAMNELRERQRPR